MKIIVSGLPSHELVDSLISFLNIKEKPSVYMQRSADPPSVVQIIGSIIDWIDPFKIAALAFLTELSREAAKDVYKNKAKILNALKLKTVKPLYDFIVLIFDAKNKTNRNTYINVSLNIPDNFFGTSLQLNLDSEEDLAWQFANFIIRLESIETEIKSLMQSKKSPLVPISLFSQNDGSIIIKYLDKVDLQYHEIIIEQIQEKF